MSPRRSATFAVRVTSADAVAGLAERLWRERELLDDLHFALTAQLALLRSGEVRWAGRADDAVRAALAALDECELLRAMDADVVARSCGLPVDVSLATLARAVPAPWTTILADHHRALLTATVEVDRVASETLALIGSPSTPALGLREIDSEETAS